MYNIYVYFDLSPHFSSCNFFIQVCACVCFFFVPFFVLFYFTLLFLSHFYYNLFFNARFCVCMWLSSRLIRLFTQFLWYIWPIVIFPHFTIDGVMKPVMLHSSLGIHPHVCHNLSLTHSVSILCSCSHSLTLDQKCNTRPLHIPYMKLTLSHYSFDIFIFIRFFTATHVLCGKCSIDVCVYACGFSGFVLFPNHAILASISPII